ncbi:ABC transporter substrate-binding protein [Paenibacillus radicis (ex Xue et al. 2023)]|uniref:Extracellular solute-binding protein n=1 Tax=Paenibacillus radicis (ex Xue et al. 2023) TaxID=2972489 RepID=A0ABT1YKM2_9BACL|nr:extracellular solute-binding protein [Paenibacillus radicis (ex Xue et al. 2023)]MCR8633738.1 extracellular solute-binding protein [Paenibacillus radicis (ex Xue et al. 2023)]
MIKKPRLVAGMLLLSMAWLTACSGGSGTAGNTNSSTAGETKTDTKAEAKQTTLRFAWWGNDPRHKATLAAIDAYMKLNPHVKIEAEYMGFDGYNKKLSTQFAGKTAPDLFQYTYEWTLDLSDFLLDLNTVKNIVDMSTLPADTLKAFGSYKDRQIMAPAGMFASTTITNQDFLQKFGIPADTVWTWDKIIEEGKKIHEKDKNAYLLTADIDVINKVILQPYIMQKSGKGWVNDDFTAGFDKAQLTEGLTYLSNLYSSGAMEPFGDSTAFVGKMEQNPKWVKGEIGMLLDYVQSLDKYKQAVPNAKIGVGAFPENPGAAQSGNPMVAGTGFAIAKDSKNKEEAAKFLNWLVNDKDASMLLTTQRGIPASSTARKALEDSGKLNPDISKGLDLAAKKKAVAPNVISTNAELAQIVKDSIQKLIYNKATPEQAADEILKGFNAKLKELKS